MSNPVYEFSADREESPSEIAGRILCFARIGIAASDSTMNVKLSSSDIQALLETIAKDAWRLTELVE
jgi:hypothetical protein